MKITTNNGTTIELSDSFNGEITVNGVSYKITCSPIIPVSPAVENNNFVILFSRRENCQKIAAIKFLRSEFNLGLKEAKDMVDRADFGGTGHIFCTGVTQKERVIKALASFGYCIR